jgi:hypothetical protein
MRDQIRSEEIRKRLQTGKYSKKARNNTTGNGTNPTNFYPGKANFMSQQKDVTLGDQVKDGEDISLASERDFIPSPGS